MNNLTNNTINNPTNISSPINNSSHAKTWTRQDELSLIKDVSRGEDLDKLAQTGGRTRSSLELRLKKIIYENVVSGKTVKDISKGLNMNEESVAQHCLSYRELLEKKGIKDLNDINLKLSDINKTNKLSQTNHNHQSGGADILVKKMNRRIKQIEEENSMMKTIIENKELHRKLNKMVKDGTINHNVKSLLKEFKKHNKNNK